MSRVLVTGGGGFVGQALCKALREAGHQVRALQRSAVPALQQLGVETVAADISDTDRVVAACQDVDSVFHVAAKAGAWGPYEDYHRANVLGTENVLVGCRQAGVRFLVYTSTPSVVHAGGDLAGVNESAPYAEHFQAPYPQTKAIAEQAVLAAGGNLRRVALRPHLVWGPGDNHLLPRVVERARQGKLAFIGAADKLIDVTYVDNAVDAHLQAWLELQGEGRCDGRAYFISDGQPIAIKTMINRMLQAAGLDPVNRHVPLPLARMLAPLVETAWRTLRLRGEPMLTRFVVDQFATAHWYDIGAAQRDFGYAPKVDLEQGMRRLQDSLAAAAPTS